MQAMIFAAGLGTRLGELTLTRPKALIPVAGVPMLERVATRLVDAGVTRIIVNVHHHAEQIIDFVESRAGFGVAVEFSRELEMPLETGGGLKQAAPLLARDAPFYLHNSDILSDLPLRDLFRRHVERGPLATLAVMERSTSRYLLFDDQGLFGRVDERASLRIEVRETIGVARSLAFGGVHVVSPEIFPRLDQHGRVFSILDTYLAAAEEGCRIEPYRIDSSTWIDIGKPEQLAEAERTVLREVELH
jgi:NDP-sugar pyrophosphorylase family protein